MPGAGQIFRSAQKRVFELATLEGPLRLSGSGTWDLKAGLKGAGSAEHAVQAPPELPQFLRAVCTEYRNNRCGFRFAL